MNRCPSLVNKGGKEKTFILTYPLYLLTTNLFPPFEMAIHL